MSGHNLVVTISGGNGLEKQLVCHEPEDAPCRKLSYGVCTIVHDFDCDPDAAIEDYVHEKTITLIDAPVTVRCLSEWGFE